MAAYRFPRKVMERQKTRTGPVVSVPSLNRQEKILQIVQLDLQAKGLEARIAEMWRIKTETILFQCAQGVLRPPRRCAGMVEQTRCSRKNR